MIIISTMMRKPIVKILTFDQFSTFHLPSLPPSDPPSWFGFGIKCHACDDLDVGVIGNVDVGDDVGFGDDVDVDGDDADNDDTDGDGDDDEDI